MTAADPMQTILLATERTPFDAGAERLAIELARCSRRNLHVVMPLFGNPEYQVEAPDLLASAEAGARQALAALAAQAAAHEVVLASRVREGEEPWREIVDEARELHADLLVTRRVGRRGVLARLLVGGMVSQVAAHATAPVLMAAETATMWSQRVLAVVEPHAHAAFALQVAVRLAGLGRARLQAVYLGETGAADAEALFEATAEIARRERVAFEGVQDKGVLDASTARLVSASGADLLVLGLAHGRTAHGRLSAAVEALVGAVPCPIVIVGAHSAPA